MLKDLNNISVIFALHKKRGLHNSLYLQEFKNYKAENQLIVKVLFQRAVNRNCSEKQEKKPF